MIKRLQLSSKTLFLFSLVFILACSTSSKKEEVQLDAQFDIDSLISEMTLEEKVAMIHASSSFTTGGVPRLGIPEWTMSDGPHGVRKEHGRDWAQDEGAFDSVTYLPVGVALAATWNPELGYEFGKVLGSEARARGKDVILGPGVNIIRTPLNGRNFEYMSEDPYLVSQMVVGYVKGVQEQDVAACVKHYAANNQEIERNTIDVEMSERALREIYLPGFKAAIVDAGAYTLMGAYNKFRGQFCTHNEYLVNKILKDEWGFGGAVVSDWGAVHDTKQALLYGTDVEMGTDLSMLPNPDYNKFYMANAAIEMIRTEQVAEAVIDEKVSRILGVMQKTNIFGERRAGAVNTKEHQATALKVAEEGIVLLKNSGVLPLDNQKVKSIAVIGANADRKHAGAGGSSQVNAKYEITPLAGLRNHAGPVSVTYAAGYEIVKDKGANPELIEEATKAASAAEVVIYVGGWIHGYTDGWNDNAYDAESLDKPSLTLPFGQDELIQAVMKANPNTIVVLMGGAAADMSKWNDKAKAILQAWYPGMEGGNALAKILFGQVNPSGKLPMTFPKKLSDVSAHALGEYPGQDGKVIYKDDIFVGYRYFDTQKIQPLFAFGHGLSYTTFQYGKPEVVRNGEEVHVKMKIKNTGSRSGGEVIQLYVKDVQASVPRPDKELKAFRKVFLEAGEEKELELTLTKEAFQYFDEGKMDWTMEPGRFVLSIGSSSRDIRQTAEIEL
jgi:beta-glucosidase